MTMGCSFWSASSVILAHGSILFFLQIVDSFQLPVGLFSSRSKPLCPGLRRDIKLSPLTNPPLAIYSGHRPLNVVSETLGSSTSVPIESVDDAKASAKSTRLSSFEKFDYLSCWYPVSWAQDLPVNKPTKVTLFDTDYVVARIPKTGQANGGASDKYEVICLVDRCPHKSAELSEGRITSCGHFQCAYHGWTFDGKNGTCVEIPQALSVNQYEVVSPSSVGFGARTSATAVPAMISQGIVWLFPGGNLEKAMLAPPPPRIPEMDMPGFRMSPLVRDLPIDWPILLENIMDPDHGMFAHGSRGFDLYSASADMPQSIEERETNHGKGWTITSRVDAVEKLKRVDLLRRGEKNTNNEAAPNVKVATITFQAPNVLTWARRDKKTGETSFVGAFWICPVGVGKTRFMSTNIHKIPFNLPRWFYHVHANNFLDQDTFLLATQQKYVLAAEAEAVRKLPDDADPLKTKYDIRKNLFVYRSPSEKLGVRLGAFFDATLARCPNRLSSIRSMPIVKNPKPEREVVLDRYKEHTYICPDSRDVVQNCDNIITVSKVGSILLAVSKVLAVAYSPSGSSVAKSVNAVLRPRLMGTVLALAATASGAAKKLRREFSFKFTEQIHDRDLRNIPKLWRDPQ